MMTYEEEVFHKTEKKMLSEVQEPSKVGKPVRFGDIAARVASDKVARDKDAYIESCKRDWPAFKNAIMTAAVGGQTSIQVYGSFVQEVCGRSYGIEWLKEVQGLNVRCDSDEGWVASWG